jgi:hypothetical protein
MSAGKGVPDHTVDVFLARAGAGGVDSLLLGRTVTGADGAFHAEFAVPATTPDGKPLTLRRYDIWLSSPEDARFNAALSQQ